MHRLRLEYQSNKTELIKMMRGEALYNRLMEQTGRLDAYLTKVIAYAYNDLLLIGSPALSRVPDASTLLLRVCQQSSGKPSRRRNWVALCAKILSYYLKNFSYLAVILVHGIVFRLSKLRFKADEIEGDSKVVVINSFTMIDRIFPTGRFDDGYFGELYNLLQQAKVQSVNLCLLFGDRPWRLRRRLQTYNILAEDARNFITEYELMEWPDWVRLIGFIFVYPLSVIRLMGQSFGEFDAALRLELNSSLDLVQAHVFSRYFVGRRLGRLSRKHLKLINWYENQVTDKMLFRGARAAGIPVTIYGCQFFIKCPLYTNLNPLDVEGEFGVLPDIILDAGRQEQIFASHTIFKPGLSPRYSYLFDTRIEKTAVMQQERLVVLLTYDIEESCKVIDLVTLYHREDSQQTIYIKLHPNHVLTQPFNYPDAWRTTDQNLSSLCRKTALVITSGSSSALEAAVMGCSVIIVGNERRITINPMPDYGRGELWELVFDFGALKRAVSKLLRYRRKHPEELAALATKIRGQYFKKATDDKYLELLDLEQSAT